VTAALRVAGVAVLADVSGALFQPDTGTLIVADLHLEKGSHFARRGQFLPPYDTRATLDRLIRAIRRFRPRHVVCLGDSFHDVDAGARLDPADRDLLRRLVSAQSRRRWTLPAGCGSRICRGPRPRPARSAAISIPRPASPRVRVASPPRAS
jgi:metallophosphoesterase superfamily enzyme